MIKLKYVVTAVVVAAGFGLFGYLRERNLSQYTVVRPHRGEITEAVYGLGKVKSIQRFEVKIGVISTVKHLFVNEGDAVHKGDKLIELDSSAVFRAPFDGTVTLVLSRTGETVLPQVPILRLENLKDRYIEVSLEQQGALRVRAGQSARISFESLRGTSLSGKVYAIFPREDEFLADIRTDKLDDSVLPGMTADVSIEVAHIADALLVPLTAVHEGFVTLARGGRRQKIKVDVGHVDGQWAEIKDGALGVDDEILARKAAVH